MEDAFGSCYLHVFERAEDKARLGCEVILTVMAIYFILKVDMTLLHFHS